MLVKEVLDFYWIDILATSDSHVLAAPNNVAIALRI